MNASSHAALPRRLTDTVLWTGGCLNTSFNGRSLHGHFSCFVVRGSKASFMIDSGHPIHRPQIERDLREFLGGRPLDYLFLTHAEFPHAGLVGRWLEAYEGLQVVGNIRDNLVYYPHYADRFRSQVAGDAIDLGDRRIVFLPAIWRDLPDSLWAFDTKDRVLFVSDGFSYLHSHTPGECNLLVSERPRPDLDMIRFFNERALLWTQYADAAHTFAAIDDMLRALKPRLIAGAHGGVIDNVEAVLSLFKEGMRMAPRA